MQSQSFLASLQKLSTVTEDAFFFLNIFSFKKKKEDLTQPSLKLKVLILTPHAGRKCILEAGMKGRVRSVDDHFGDESFRKVQTQI